MPTLTVPLTVGHLVMLFIFITLCALGLFNMNKHFCIQCCMTFFILMQKQINILRFMIVKVNFFYAFLEGKRRDSAVPVLKSETVTSDLPDRLIIVGCSLSRQKKVLVEETLFVPFKLDGPTSHHEQCGLALGCLFCEREHCDYCAHICNNYVLLHTFSLLLKAIIRIKNTTCMKVEIAQLTMNWLTIQGVNLELARRKRLEKLAQSILSRHGIPIPHQRCLVQVKPGQVLRKRSR